MKKSLCIILLLLTLGSCAIYLDPYDQDLKFIHKTILDNHPGVYNDQDPDFEKNLEESYLRAKTKLHKGRNSDDQKKAIDEFAKGFHDNHLWIRWNNTKVPNFTKNKNVARFFITFLTDQIIWITLPTFDLNADQQKEFEKLNQEIAKLRKKEYIIFDLRGNQGGNSEYCSTLVNSLYGEEYADHRRHLANKLVSVDWRASEGNLNHVISLLVRYKSDWLKRVAEGLKQSLAQGKEYYRESFSMLCNPTGQTKNTHHVAARLIIIIDSGNVSAALNFIDEIKMITPNVVLVGQPTKADRLYMEVRSVPLPSELGNFSFPIKVFRNRPRLDNQPYLPDIKYEDIANTPELQKFIIKNLKQKKF